MIWRDHVRSEKAGLKPFESESRSESELKLIIFVDGEMFHPILFHFINHKTF